MLLSMSSARSPGCNAAISTLVRPLTDGVDECHLAASLAISGVSIAR